jgi:glucose-1-phosphate adenylyltransferase
MELLATNPPFDIYDSGWPIHTHAEVLPPAKIASTSGRRGFVGSSLLAAGTVVGCSTVTSSVLATGVWVGDGTMLDEAVALPNARIGSNCRLRRVIVDSGTEVPDGTVIGWQAGPIERVAEQPVALVTAETVANAAKDFRSVA